METKKEKINLEGLLYDKEGRFSPLPDSYGNTSGKIAHLRDTYLEVEREYFEQLLADESTLKLFISLLDYSPEDLFEYATKLQNKLEYGMLETEKEKARMQTMSTEEKEEFHMKKLETAEGILCLALAAIRDKVKMLELVRTLTLERGGNERGR